MSRTTKIAAILLALLLSSSMYLYGLLRPVENSHYTGLRSINASDYNVNLAWIQQFREGHFLLRNLFTSEPHSGMLVRPIYFALSWPLVKLIDSNPVVLHVMRLACAIALLFALFPLLRAFIQDESITTLAFFLLVFSSGAGVLLKAVVPDSADLSIPEAIFFLTLGEPPHFLYSLLFVLIGITAIYWRTQNKPASLPLFLLALVLLWWEHPFDAVTLLAVAFAVLWQVPGARAKSWILVTMIALSVPPFLYYRNLEKLPAFAGWSAQNVMTSPSVAGLVSGYLPLLLLAVPGFLMLHRDAEGRSRAYFLLCWIAVQFTLCYLPIAFQRRLIGGIQFPLAVLAAFGLNRFPRPAAILVIVVCSFGNIAVSLQQIRDLRPGQMPFYLPQDYQEAFRWLAERKPKGAVVSGFVTGNFIPAYTGCAVFAGHSALTPDIQKKKEQIAQFYAEPSEEFLKSNHLLFAFWGLEERHLARKGSPFLALYRNDTVMISGTDRISPLLRASRPGIFRSGNRALRFAHPPQGLHDLTRIASHIVNDR